MCQRVVAARPAWADVATRACGALVPHARTGRLRTPRGAAWADGPGRRPHRAEPSADAHPATFLVPTRRAVTTAQPILPLDHALVGGRVRTASTPGRAMAEPWKGGPRRSRPPSGFRSHTGGPGRGPAGHLLFSLLGEPVMRFATRGLRRWLTKHRSRPKAPSFRPRLETFEGRLPHVEPSCRRIWSPTSPAWPRSRTQIWSMPGG